MDAITRFLELAWHELRRALHGGTVLIFLAAAGLTLALGLGDETQSTAQGGARRLALIVVDNDRGALAAELVDLLRGSDLVYPQLRSPAEAAADYQSGRSPAILTIPASFSVGLLSGSPVPLDLFVAPDDPAVLTIQQGVKEASARLNSAVVIARQSALLADAVAPFSTGTVRASYLQHSLQTGRMLVDEAPLQTRLEPGAAPPAPSLPRGVAAASPGQMVLWALALLLGAAPGLAEDRRTGVLRRILYHTTGGPLVYLLGRLAGRLVPTLALLAFLVGFGLPLGAAYDRSPLAAMLVLLSFGLMGGTLGLLVGALCRSERAAQAWRWGLALGLGLLGGAWLPLAAFPPLLRSSVSWLPTAWAVGSLQNILLGSGALAYPAAAILLGWALLFLLAARLALTHNRF